MKTKKKILVLALAMILVAAASVAGTLAWLTDKTVTKKNTFTVGNIDIDLTETETEDVFEVSDNEYSFKMVPNKELKKDPKVTVKKGSEDSWVFIKIAETCNVSGNGFTDYIDYSVNISNWTALSGVDGVYYLEYTENNSEDKVYSVLTDDKVKVKSTVTKEMMDALLDGSGQEIYEYLPKLEITAYAVQKDGVASASAAWAIANSSN